MTGILRFTLPDEQDDWETTLRAHDWRMLTEETLQRIRNALKYDAWEHTSTRPTTPEEALEWVRRCIVADADARDLSLR